MMSKIPSQILTIQKKFTQADFKLYLVGGSVRDLLQNKPVKDWDMTTDATPEDMLKLFSDAFYDNAFGTVGIPVEELKETEHSGVVEVTTFRTERGYDDRRHPTEVKWGKTIEEDLARRDFTMNAIAIELLETIDMSNPKLIDPYNGQQDIQNKLIRAVGNPNERFKENALRLMRAIRFAAQHGFEIEEKTLQAITNDASLLSEIAGERIREELLKLLASDYPYEGVMLLKNTGLLNQFLPELIEGIGVSQTRPGRHHKDDVFTHNVLSLKHCPSTDPVVRTML